MSPNMVSIQLTRQVARRLRIDASAGDPVEILADAPAGSTVYFPPETYVNPSGLGNGLTVNADNITIELAAGAEIQCNTWGQPGIDAFGRSGIKVKGGTVRYTGVRGNHLGNSGRAGALYTMGAGVFFDHDRCSVQGLRTVNMPVGVFFSGYAGSTATDYRGTNNRVQDLEVEGANWGVLWTFQKALKISGLYFHDDIDDSSGANPTHSIYCSSSDTARSYSIVLSDLITENCLYGQPYQIKYADNIVMNNLISRNSRGLLNVIGCEDLAFTNSNAKGSLGSLVSPFGAITVQGGGAKRHRYLNISIEQDQTDGVDQRAVLMDAEDSLIDNLSVIAKRVADPNNPIVQIRGLKNTVRNVDIRNTGGVYPPALQIGGSSVDSTGTNIEGMRTSGTVRAVDLYGPASAIIKYEGTQVVTTSGTKVLSVSGSPTFTLYDRQQGNQVFDVRDYGALGTWTGASGSDDTAAILAAVTAMQAAGVAGTLWFPARPTGQSYKMTSEMPNVPMRIAGPDRSTTRISFVGTNMFTVGSGTLTDVIVEGLYISVSAGHLVALTGGSFYKNVFRDCLLYIQTDGKSLVSQNGSGDFIENTWEKLDLWRNSTATVPAFDIVNSSGGANANVFKRIRASGQNGTGAPFWRIEASTTGTYAYDNTFEDIVGEQNPGGLIHLYSNTGAFIRNCYDWDATTNYADHVIKVDKSSTSTTESRAITVINVGRRGGTLGGGSQDFYASSGSREISLINVGNHTTTAVVTVPASSSSVQGRAGFSVGTNDYVKTGRNTTGNRPLAATVGTGAMFYDTTLSKPIWSDGTTWRDAAGTSV